MMNIKIFLMSAMIVSSALFAASNQDGSLQEGNNEFSTDWAKYSFGIQCRLEMIRMATPEGYWFDPKATLEALEGRGTGPFYRKIEDTEKSRS